MRHICIIRQKRTPIRIFKHTVLAGENAYLLVIFYEILACYGIKKIIYIKRIGLTQIGIKFAIKSLIVHRNFDFRGVLTKNQTLINENDYELIATIDCFYKLHNLYFIKINPI